MIIVIMCGICKIIFNDLIWALISPLIFIPEINVIVISTQEHHRDISELEISTIMKILKSSNNPVLCKLPAFFIVETHAKVGEQAQSSILLSQIVLRKRQMFS